MSEPTAGQPADPSSTPPAQSQKGCLVGCLGTAALVIAVAVGCSVLGSSGGNDAPTDIEAELMCQEWVKDKLKAPSTAKFSETSSTGGPQSWSVTGAVDSENSFGAMVRAAWTCNIRLDGDTWRGSATVIE